MRSMGYFLLLFFEYVENWKNTDKLNQNFVSSVSNVAFHYKILFGPLLYFW